MIGIGDDVLVNGGEGKPPSDAHTPYQGLFRELSDGVIILRPSSEHGRFIICEMNPAAERIDKISMDQAMGKEVSQMLPAPCARMITKALVRVMENGKAEHIPKASFQARGGQIRNREVWVYRLSGEDMAIVFRDNTKELRNEAMLQESERKFREVFDSANDSVTLSELKEDFIPGRMTDVSRGATLLTGHTMEELKQMTPFEIVASESDVPMLARSLREEGYFDGHVTIKKKDGTPAPVWLHLRTIQMGEERLVLSVARDLTKEERMSSALMEANRKLNLLSSITRHDTLNLVMALRGLLEISRSNVSDPDRMRTLINKEVRLAEQIEQHISYTRDYQDLGVKAPFWQDVAGVIALARAGLSSETVSVNVAFRGLEVSADALLGKVFFNLIDNAIRHGGADLRNVWFSAETEGRGLCIVCADDGNGISEEARSHLFQQGSGKSGLGLFLTKEILSITGITISENGTDGGARFELHVPPGGFRYTS